MPRHWYPRARHQEDPHRRLGHGADHDRSLGGQEATPTDTSRRRAKRDETRAASQWRPAAPLRPADLSLVRHSAAVPCVVRFDDAARTIPWSDPREAMRLRLAAGPARRLIDESVYRHPPSVLLATVDKFARMPWVPDAASLFGRATARAPPTDTSVTRGITRYRLGDPKSVRRRGGGPGISLIIQDELHLISRAARHAGGPLRDRRRVPRAARAGSTPKVIASTATIRRAGDQVRGLYGRRTPRCSRRRRSIPSTRSSPTDAPRPRRPGACMSGLRPPARA